MLTHKNSKYLFYSFNNFLNRIEKQPKLVCRTKISDDTFVLENLLERKWSYFLQRPLTVPENEDSFLFSTQSSVEENQIIFDTIEKLVLCKSMYNPIYIGIADNFREYLQSLPQNEFDNIDQDLHSNDIFFENLQHETHSKEIINAFNYFFYKHGWFSGNLNLITIRLG